MLFGSYARGDFGRSSDVDVLVLLDGTALTERTDAHASAAKLVNQVEFEFRLPMHLAPLVANAEHPEVWGSDLIEAIWSEGVILYARAGVLARFRPPGLAPWMLARFSVAAAPPADRVRLSRRLHGVGKRPGLIRPPALALGPGVVLVPGHLQQALRDALDDAGATYDLFPIWRDTRAHQAATVQAIRAPAARVRLCRVGVSACRALPNRVDDQPNGQHHLPGRSLPG